MGIPFALFARFVVWLLGFSYPTLVGLGLQKEVFVGRAYTKNQLQDYRQEEEGRGRLAGMDKGVERDKLAAARMAVLHAALRTKRYLRGLARGPVSGALLLRELEGFGYEVQRTEGGDGVVGRQMLVRVARVNPPGEAELEDLAAEAGRRGLALGMLVDFSRDLMLDGVTMVTAGGMGWEEESQYPISNTQYPTTKWGTGRRE